MFRLFSLLPFAVLRGLCAFIAFWVRVLRWRRHLVDKHLGHCLTERTPAEREAVAVAFYRYLGELLAEVLHAARMPKPQLVERVRLENPGDLQSVFDEGKRVLILAAHHCNWEWLLLRCSTAFDVPMTAAYKPATMPSGDRALKHMRSRFGATMVPAKQLVQHLLEQRGSVRLLALLADQSPAVSNEQQTWLQFFGRDTAFYKGAGWIATKLGYTVWFAAMRREQSGRYAVRFVRLDRPDERMDADAVLQAYASTLEAHVHAYPVEYFWAYKRWKRQKRLYDT